MLPQELSNNLCSLHTGSPKLTMTVIFYIDETGKLLHSPEPQFFESVISTVGSFNYEEIQKIIDERNRPSGEDVYLDFDETRCSRRDIVDDIILLNHITQNMRKVRFDEGSLTLHRAQLKFMISNDDDPFVSNYLVECHGESHQIVEEMMLMANRVVAEKLVASNINELSVLRKHSPAVKEDMLDLEQKFERLGLTLKYTSAQSIDLFIKQVWADKGFLTAQAIESMIINPILQALYTRYAQDGESYRHWALNMDYYTHFTSPIRRYPDILVHRALKICLTNDSPTDLPDYEWIDIFCGQCNDKKEQCRKFQEIVSEKMFCLLIKANETPYRTTAVVLSISDKSIIVWIWHMAVQRRIHFDTISEVSQKSMSIDGNFKKYSIFPQNWTKCERNVDVLWTNDDNESRTQTIKELDSVRVIILPCHTVPIDYTILLISPLSADYRIGVKSENEQAAEYKKMFGIK
eukprot:GHVL01025655.1.p1 GENE.GHVL01025655.1~~GHVL01025655.1.p1  ORF type:complete len:463 (-),score=67.19 GHVL01025655.1:50-1438(-)